MENFCVNIGGEMSKIICKNIADLTLDKGKNRLLSLSECLMYLSESNPGQPLNVVIDEYDSEELTPREAENIKNILENQTFLGSQVTIAVQSCQKKRHIEDHQDPVIEQQSHCFKDAGLTLFELHKTMRFTGSIHDVISSSQEKVKEKANCYYLSNKTEETMPRKYREDDIENEPKVLKLCELMMFSNITRDEELMPLKQAIPTQQLNHHLPKTQLKNPTPKVDSLFNQVKDEASINNTGATKLVTKFEYFKNSTSGHCISGKIPQLLIIPNFANISLGMMQNFLKHCLKADGERKLLVICNSLDLLPFTKYSLEVSKISYVEYTDCIRHRPAKLSKEKRMILEKWKSDAQVLLADCRGCRGMEFCKVRTIFIHFFLS